MKYSKNEIIEMAIQIEKSGYAFYNEALKKKNLSDSGNKLLTLLRAQEMNHEKYFISLRSNEDNLEIDESGNWELVSDYIKSITDSRLFSNVEAAIKLASESNNEKDIFEHALQFEKDTILFFHTIKDQVINNINTQNTLKSIIDEEVSHVLKLAEYKNSLLKR